MTTASSGAQREGVGGVEAQQVVISITKQMKQHLEDRRQILRHCTFSFQLCNISYDLTRYLARLCLNGLWQCVST